MNERKSAGTRRVLAVVGRAMFKAVAVFLAVLKPPEQMNAQTTLPPEPFPSRRDEYRP
jgi:hypothetical protein